MYRDRLLRWIGRNAHRYWWIVLIFVAVTIVLCVFAVMGLEITTGYVDLLPQENPAVKNYFKVLDKFGGTDNVVVMVEAPDSEQVHAVVDQLSERLSETGEFDYIQDRTDLSQFTRYGLLYLDIDTLKEIDLLLSERDMESLAEMANEFAGLREELSRTVGAGMRVDEEGYFVNEDGTAGLLIARPSFSADDVSKVNEFGEWMSELTEEIERENPGTKLWLSGSYQYQYEQGNILNRDILIVGLIAFAAIVLILAIAFRSLIAPFAAMLALGCGLLWTLGIAKVTVRSLNTVSAVFVVALMGIGIEYAIALLSRYREERAKGEDAEEAFVSALSHTGQGVITGALTTAGAFFALSFSDFKAMHDMGIVLGFGVLCALVSMLVVLPALMTLKERFFPYKPGAFTGESHTMRRLGNVVTRRSTIIVAVGLLLTIGLGISAGFIKYESNIREIQPKGMHATEAEDRLTDEFGIVSDFVTVLSSNEAAMREVTEEVAEFDSVRAVESLATIIPSDQLAKLVVMSRIQNKIKDINPEWLSFIPPEMLSILETIGSDTLTLDRLPEDASQRYISEDGFYATYVYPEKNMYEEENIVEFLDDVQSVSTDISGFPVILLDSIESTREGLRDTTLLSAIAVMLVVVIDFKAILPTVLALLPLLLSLLWMMGSINIIGMKLNLVNIAATPILLGIGVDFGVYILHRYMEEHSNSGETIPAVLARTGRAIFVSGLTVIAAFAALIFARYQGLASLGIASVIGIGFAAITALTVLPAILRILEKRRKKGRAL